MHPSTIHIFLAEGDPEGVKLITKTNWVGVAVMASRAALKRALSRDELKKPGVYTLLGEEEENGLKQIYIGQADELGTRLEQQHKAKSFWTHFIAFTSVDEMLNRATISHLESKLVDLSKQAKRWQIHNAQQPREPSLSEMDRAAAEAFLREMLVVYPILGVDAFEVFENDEKRLDQLLLVLKERDAEAKGYYTNEGMVVLKGAVLRPEPVKSAREEVNKRRKILMDQGIIQEEQGKLVFVQDYAFRSPSGAAFVLAGRHINGWDAWKTPDGIPMKKLDF